MPPAGWLARHGALVAVCLVLVVVALVRLRLADVPLERDEGEYAYAGQLILQGVPPYHLAYNMKFPGTYYAYAAVLAVFGQTARGIHLGLLTVNAATALLVFFVGRRLIGSVGGAVAAVTFSVLSLDRWIMGVFAHATHFVLLPALGGLLVFLRALDTRRPHALVGAGALLGLGVLMKQHGFVFPLLAVALLVWHERRRPTGRVQTLAVQVGWLLAGTLIPFILLVAVLGAHGVLDRFWFWTFQYASAYASELSWRAAWPMLARGWTSASQATLPLWLLAGLGVALLWLRRWAAEPRAFLSGLLIASGLAVCPGFYFLEHYFILLLPAVALLVGVAVESMATLLRRITRPSVALMLALVVFGATIVAYAVGERRYLFSMGPRELSRTRYGANPFVEAVDIARYVREHTTPQDSIAVVGSEPEIYFYAGRRSATGYIYTYPLMEPQPYAARMQDEMIRQIEAAHPRYVVFVGIPASWLVQRTSSRRILEWIERYLQLCYERVGVTEIHSRDETTILWDAAAATYTPRSSFVIDTFSRRSDAPCAASP